MQRRDRKRGGTIIMEHVRACVFFFSSRRRHTRFDCDWSSDVCSSDLSTRYVTPEALFRLRFGEGPRPTWDVAVLSFRGEAGAQALVSKLNARPLERKVLYGLEVSLDRPVVYEAELADRSIVLVTHCLWEIGRAHV